MSAAFAWRPPPSDRVEQRYGETIRFGPRRSGYAGYCAHSDRAGPGVLLGHGPLGPVDDVVLLADELNRAGFTVLAPFLFEARDPTRVGDAHRAAGRVDVGAVNAMLQAAADHLRENWHPRLGAVGLSDGAAWIASALSGRDVDALVVYYGGSGPPPTWRGGPLLVHAGGRDRRSSGWTAWADAEQRAGSSEVEVVWYPQAGHHFAEPSAGALFRPRDSAAALRASADFLLHHLS